MWSTRRRRAFSSKHERSAVDSRRQDGTTGIADHSISTIETCREFRGRGGRPCRVRSRCCGRVVKTGDRAVKAEGPAEKKTKGRARMHECRTRTFQKGTRFRYSNTCRASTAVVDSDCSNETLVRTLHRSSRMEPPSRWLQTQVLSDHRRGLSLESGQENELRDFFLDQWVCHFGKPTRVRVDTEGSMASVLLEPISGQAHWQRDLRKKPFADSMPR